MADQMYVGPRMGSLATIQGWTTVILVTRLNGEGFALNPDLIERADQTPDTVITLVDGTKYVIAESVPTLVELVRHYRASVIATAGAMDDERRTTQLRSNAEPPSRGKPGSVVPLHRREG
jgi:flagellar protein FlbD